MSPPLVVGERVRGVRSGLVPPPSEVLGTLQKMATMEGAALTPGPSGFDSTNAYTGDTRSTTTLSTAQKRRGTYSARCAYSGGPSVNGFARGLQALAPFDLGEGSVVGFGMGVWLDVGYRAANKYTDLMRLDNFDVRPTGTDHVGICIDGQQYSNANGPGGLRLIRFQVGQSNETTLGYVATDAAIPEGQWFYLEMLFTLSATAGTARNRVWLNDALVLDNTAANLFTDYLRPWSFCRYGIVAINPSVQTGALGMYVDDCYVSLGGRLGLPATPVGTVARYDVSTFGSDVFG